MRKDKHRKLYPYQRRIANHIAETNRSCILNLEMRMGKTVIALEVCNKAPMPTLIVCPAGLIKVWQDHIAKWCDRPELITLVSYTKMSKAKYIEQVKKLRCLRLIADEAHRTRNTKSVSNKAIRLLMQQKHWIQKLFLTATPIINEPLDMYLMLRNCMKKPCNKAEFINRFYICEYNYFAKGVVPTKFHHESDFIDLCQKYMIRLTHDDINKDRKYKRDINTYVVDVQSDKDTPSKVLLETPKLGLAKLERWQCRDLLCNLIGNKTIIFFSYLQTAIALKHILDYKILSGKTPKKQRPKLIEEFRKDKNAEGILLSINAFSEGIDLSFVKNVIIFENTWSGFQDLQAIARCDAIKRTHDQTISYIVSKNERKYMIANRKMKYSGLFDWSTDLETL